MRRRAARKLYAQAWQSYQNGYVKGTESRLAREAEQRIPITIGYDRDQRPAYSAGYDLGDVGEPLRSHYGLPLDVWVRVLANEVKP